MNSPAPNTAAPQAEVRQKLTKKLPTFRVGAAKQLDALRAYAVLSENGTKPVHYTRIAEIIKVHEANVSSMNPFFLEANLLIKAPNGYLPTADVLEYNRSYSWKPETAALKLRGVLTRTWFGLELMQRLHFRALSEEEGIQVLAEACNAGPEAKPQLRILLELCDAAGVITRANGQLTPNNISDSEEAKPTPEPIRAPDPEPQPLSNSPRASQSHVFTEPSREGSLNFDIRVNVSMTEMQGWSADRISALFAGIAQVLAAKNQGG
jgi:hypothetical protein